MRSTFLAPALFAIAVLASAPGGAAAGDPLDAALQAIRPEALRAHVRFLADDLLEGRATGTRGHEIAARYVAARFEATGLEPGGPGGSYLEPVSLRRAEIVAEASSLTLTSAGGSRDLALGREFVPFADMLRERAEIVGQVVYVGFGVSAPDLRHDDYAAVEVRGRVVALLEGAPASFPADQRAYYSSRQVKAAEAERRGAVGILLVWPPEAERRMPYPRIAERVQAGAMSWLDESGRPRELPDRTLASLILSREGVEALFTTSPRSLESVLRVAAAGEAASFELPVAVRIRTATRHTAAESRNVLGLLRGSDPVLAREQVVVSAHLDHLGVGALRDGDAIYNGAYDNASGAAAILEIAHALAAVPRRPRRSILFAAVTGEEEGLLGAESLVHRATTAKVDFVADLNMDMFLTLYPIRDVVAFGGEHSTLGGVVRDAAGRLGLEVSPDPFAEEVIFIRSDHYAFVKKGIPSLMLACGLKSADPAVDGGAILHKWLRSVYHSPKDDAAQPMDFDSAAKIARLYVLIAHRVAEDPQRPSWNPGDFFASRFAR